MIFGLRRQSEKFRGIPLGICIGICLGICLQKKVPYGMVDEEFFACFFL